jgi:hypothetical protein
MKNQVGKGKNGKFSLAILVVMSIIISLAGVELLLKSFKPQITFSKLKGRVGSYYAPSDFNTYTLQRNYKGVEPSMEFPGKMVDVQINSQGFRGNELIPERSKILVLGDSYTFGVYVNNNETYPAQLDSLIDKKYANYQVVNAGYVGGLETDQQYSWLNREGLKLKPVIVILGICLANDIHGILPSAWTQKDSAGLPTKWQNELLFVRKDGRLLSKNININFNGIESVYKIPILRESHLAVLIGRIIDLLHNGKGGVKSEYGFAHIFGEYDNQFLNKEKLFVDLVKQMNKNVTASGATFIALLIPINFMVEREKLDLVFPHSKYRRAKSVYYTRLTEILKKENIRSVNIEDFMVKSKGGPYFPANGEPHCNPKGNSFTAQAIFKYLESNNLLTGQ